MKIYMKLLILATVLVFATVIMVACSKSSDNIEPDAPIEVPEDNINDGSEKGMEEEIVEGDYDNDYRQLGFIYDGNEISIMDIIDDQEIESMLGKADDIKSHTYSKDDGLNMDQLEGFTEKQYYYPGLVIKTIDATSDKSFFVFSIDITDEKYQTIGNIKIGDSYEKLKEAYPEGYLMSGELIDAEDDFRYEPIDYSSVINFHIKDKKVESIIMFQLLD